MVCETQEQVILASASPRRLELLQQIDVNCKVLPVNIPEVRKHAEMPENYVQRLSLEKARAGQQLAWENNIKGLPIIGADTTVVVDVNGSERVLEKPLDKWDALSMLGQLSGRTHSVLSAVAMVNKSYEKVLLNHTRVTFRHVDQAEMVAYWETGEPSDKAGSYGIQGLGGVFVEKIEGSYSSVMGLPIWETCQLLTEFQVPYWYVRDKLGSSNG